MRTKVSIKSRYGVGYRDLLVFLSNIDLTEVDETITPITVTARTRMNGRITELSVEMEKSNG